MSLPEDSRSSHGCPACGRPYGLRDEIVESQAEIDSLATEFGNACDQIEQLSEKLPCGCRKVDMDDSYGGCVFCGFKDGYHEYEDEVERLLQGIKRVADDIMWDAQSENGPATVKAMSNCATRIESLLTKDTR